MHQHSIGRSVTVAVVAVVAVTALSSCRESDDARATSAAPEEAASGPTAAGTDGTSTSASPASTATEDWCAQQASTLFGTPFPGPSATAISTYAAAWRTALARPFSAGGGATPVTALGTVEQAGSAALSLLDAMDAATLSGDLEGALRLAEQVDDVVVHRLAATAISGEPCGPFGPEHAADASLEVPLLAGWQIGSGFGTVWVAREFATVVDRLDPSTGEIVATVELGAPGFKMQAADGRMWVRTSEAYVAVDPDTNAVAATLRKADVGPAANRSWAVDGGLWICDGTRLHRYDPAELSPLATVELQIDCGQVYATADLVVAWTYDEEDGESGRSAAALVDPRTNQVVHRVSLPMDALVPVVLEDVVYFPGNLNDRAATVDRATGAVTETASLGTTARGSQTASDGEVVFVPAKDTDQIVVVDARTFEVRDVLLTLGVNSVEVADGRLWTANNVSGFTQAFDI